mmetsp:Transcript_5627/g.8516  ORF Transcript_5627/g.8516 Transcript_5627/m.8516 type:complete len:256 (-) Transcript_5627:297-1064(-)
MGELAFLESEALSFFLGLSLSAACGIRAFIPLVLYAAFYQLGEVTVSEDLAWAVHYYAIGIFGFLALLEISLDKIHLPDWANTVMAPFNIVAGAFIVIVPDYGTIWYYKAPCMVLGAVLAFLVWKTMNTTRRWIEKKNCCGKCTQTTCWDMTRATLYDIACIGLSVIVLEIEWFAVLVAVFFLVLGIWHEWHLCKKRAKQLRDRLHRRTGDETKEDDEENPEEQDEHKDSETTPLVDNERPSKKKKKSSKKKKPL